MEEDVVHTLITLQSEDDQAHFSGQELHSSAGKTEVVALSMFGCPTYILDNKLQGKLSIPKWFSHTRLGVYLGPSPNHSRSVGLVLNPRTGQVLLQFHVKHDEFFKTVLAASSNYDSPPANWKQASRLTGPTHTMPERVMIRLQWEIKASQIDNLEQLQAPENDTVSQDCSNQAS